MGATAQIDVSISGKLTGTAGLGTPIAPISILKSIQLASGTDALGKVDVLWADQRTLAASATENLDLAGVLAGLLGGTVTAAEIVAIYVEADAANTNDVVLFGAGSNPFNGSLTGTTPKVAVGPGDVFLLTNRKGMTVTAATGDIMLVANSSSGTAVTYKIVLLGRTVAA
jgi:hypothetical protein